jgi:enterochelin esterase-like enzyme
MENKMEEISSQRKLEALEENGTLIRKDGKTFLQLDCENAKELSMKWGEKLYPFTKTGKKWILELPFSTPVNYVQICIDGQEVLSPELPIAHGYGRPYNYIELPDEDGLFELRDVPHGTLTQEFYKSQISDNWEKLILYLPPCVPSAGLPVLYLQHGHGENETCWVSQGKMNFIYDNLVHQRKAVPAIVVMANGMIYKESGDKRELKYRDMSEFVKEELIPYVENKYRTYGDKEHRAMAGLSMGSLQTSITAFEHSELFSYVGVFSGFVQDILTQNQSHLTEKNKESFRENNKLFFRGIGAEDRFIDFFKSDDEFLEKSKIKCERKIYKGDHEWKVWRRCLYDFAQLIFREDN